MVTIQKIKLTLRDYSMNEAQIKLCKMLRRWLGIFWKEFTLEGQQPEHLKILKEYRLQSKKIGICELEDDLEIPKK